MTNPYVPLLIMGGLALLLGFGGLAASTVIGPQRYNKVKVDAYECGIQPSPHASGSGKFPVKYYLTAMLFIIFDIEALFLYPFAVAFDELGAFTLGAVVLFLFNAFFIADAYVWRRGGFEWD